ncbi:SUMO-targeted ubiquitin ligase complex subunit slx8 [Cadophora gregata]|uniref:SUMO-targeted ubiquitin ligase complex subunit slx8 n=1 Tax=Cadophora gregata TaxID=51156 RepID=UPI0026DD8DFD|nr:SUMO-targeted ubiquitin ligase complex subunit slx8 [Cadophora gregata]KAK0123632.1 SUMO-targeted ubiquitin ligase complex subunit slx8 [Cadophora gregata]
MSFNPFRRHAALESANESPAEGSPVQHSSQLNEHLHTSDSNSPFVLFDSDQAEDEPSPWSASSSGSGYDSLTLPPINPDNNFHELPSFNNSQYFDALPRIQSPSSFLASRSRNAAGDANTNLRPQSRNSQENHQEPPPSNQQQRRPQCPLSSQYRLAGSESPDPFGELDFIDLSPPPGDIPSHSTRQSSFVDLTESSPAAMSPASRKRKAPSPGVGRSSKVAKGGSSRTAHPTSAVGTKKDEMSEVPTIDLVDVEDKKDYDERMAKEQAEMIKRQNQEAATKSVKLAEFQCIICMDQPTDLTVTYCGMYLSQWWVRTEALTF